MGGLRLLLVFLGLLIWGQPVFATGTTLDEIRERDQLICGVDDQHMGFSFLDENGAWRGFDVDFCRVLAAAVLGDADKVKYMPLNAQTRFSALSGGEVDILFRSTTVTFSRDTSMGFDFPYVLYYDRLGIMVHNDFGYDGLVDVDQATVCVGAGTTTLSVLRKYIAQSGKALDLRVFNSREGLNNFFFSGQCELYAADHSALMTILQSQAPNPSDYRFLSDQLSKEPLGPVVRGDDRQWYHIVHWVLNGVMDGEERGIESGNVDRLLVRGGADLQYLMGRVPGLGHPLGLADDWLYQVIKQVGNYREIFDRNLGMDSKLKIERGRNALWINGGLHYPFPMQ